MYLKAETVQYLYEDFWADGETTVMKGFSRCCVKSVYGEALEYDFHEMMARFGEVVGKMGAFSGSIDKVTLRRHVNWALMIQRLCADCHYDVAGYRVLCLSGEEGEHEEAPSQRQWRARQFAVVYLLQTLCGI